MSEQVTPDAATEVATSGAEAHETTKTGPRQLPASLAAQRVLVPLDGSPYAERSLAFSAALARLAGVGVTLAYVRTPFVSPTIPQRDHIIAHYPDRDTLADVSDYPTYLAWLRQGMLHHVADVDVTICDADSASKGLIELEATEPGALVVLASHAYQGMERVLLGSVADEVIRHGRAPVLVVPPRVQVPSSATLPPLARLTVALDGSQLAETVLEPVLGLIAAQGAANREVEPIMLTLLGIAPVQESLAHTRRYLEQLRQLIEPTLPHSSVPVRTQAEVGAATEAILAAVDPSAGGHGGTRAPSDLLAMATHGRGGLGLLLYGSVAREVVPRSSVPVLLVHPRHVDF